MSTHGCFQTLAMSSPVPMQMHTWVLIHPNLTFAYESGGVSIVLSVCMTKRTERSLFRKQKDWFRSWLRVVQPGFRQYTSAYLMGLQMRQKPMGTVSLGKDQQTLGTVQNTAGTIQPSHSLLMTDDSLGGFSIVFVNNALDRCDHSWKTHFFLKHLPLKFFGRWCFLGLGCPWSCSNSVQTGSEAYYPYSINMFWMWLLVLKMHTYVDHFIVFVKTGCTWLDIWPN